MFFIDDRGAGAFPRPARLPGVRHLAVVTAACIGLCVHAATAGEPGPLHERIAAAAEGDVVELPPGTFELDRPLVIDKPISIVGAGRDETIIRSAATDEGVVLRIQNVSDVRLAGFTLDGAGNPHLTQGILMSDGSGHRLEQLRIQDIPGGEGFGPHAIYASSNITDSVFARIEIRNIGPDSEWGAGIRLGRDSRSNLVEDCDLANLGRGGILTTHGSTDTRIRRNRVRDFGFAGPALGIEVWGSGERVVIEDNTVDHWISVDGQTDVAVRRNTITGADDDEHIGSYGLELVNSKRVVMTDNVMEGGNHIGLSVSNRARKDLAYWARNRLLNSETWGAQIQGEEGGAHRMYFHQNIFEGTRRTDRSLYPGAAGHGFRFNGNAFQMVLHGNRFRDNAGALVKSAWLASMFATSTATASATTPAPASSSAARTSSSSASSVTTSSTTAAPPSPAPSPAAISAGKPTTRRATAAATARSKTGASITPTCRTSPSTSNANHAPASHLQSS